MIDVQERWDWNVSEDEIDEEIELTPEEEWDEEVKFWGYQARWPGKIGTKEKTMNKMMMKEPATTVETLEQTQKLCQALMQSPHYQKMGKEGIFAIVQKSKAVGVDPLDALNGGMYYVQGKVEMTSTMMNDLIRRQGHSITKDKTSNAEICILHGKRKDNNDTWCENFSIEDAKQAGIYRNQWLKYPKDMLFARALSRLARQLFPDVIKGCYVEEEIKQAYEAKLESPPLVTEEVVMTVDEMRETIENNIDVPHQEHLEEYLTFCRERVQKPMREVIESWLKNPEPFKTHYGKWVSKKNVDNTIEVQEDEDRAPSFSEEHA